MGLIVDAVVLVLCLHGRFRMKKCSFSMEFCDSPVQVGARSRLMSIYKLEMRISNFNIGISPWGTVCVCVCLPCLQGDIECDSEAAFELAAEALQATCGDYSESVNSSYKHTLDTSNTHPPGTPS